MMNQRAKWIVAMALIGVGMPALARSFRDVSSDLSRSS
jgi:hypothetical protein